MAEPITKSMHIQDVIQRYPETVEVFRRHKLDCMNCQIAEFEEVCHGAAVHKIDPDLLISELNDAVSKKGGKN